MGREVLELEEKGYRRSKEKFKVRNKERMKEHFENNGTEPQKRLEMTEHVLERV